MPNNNIRTRFAPSPTGYMHVGNLRTALYTYLMAKHEDGTFILRIEDTDQGRYVEGAVDVIYNTLRETGLLWDEGPDIGGPVGPYVQSERMGMFKQYAEQLVAEGKAYYCFCTEERLEALHAEQRAHGEMTHYDGCCRDLPREEVEKRLAAGEPYVIRQKIPREGVTGFDDMVYGHIEVNNSEMDDQILIKTDGMPTYNFANVVDDHLMGITHVIRGSEYLSSTPKYNLLYQAFGWNIPNYIHCPPVMKDAQNKLSKRNGDASYQDLVAKGYLTEAILNYICLLGWSTPSRRSSRWLIWSRSGRRTASPSLPPSSTLSSCGPSTPSISAACPPRSSSPRRSPGSTAPSIPPSTRSCSVQICSPAARSWARSPSSWTSSTPCPSMT